MILMVESFNSRTLGGVRLVFFLRKSLTLIRFQFTHPGRGATLRFRYFLVPWYSFNSRTLGGVRLRLTLPLLLFSLFQFTPPGRGATPAAIPAILIPVLFQFTHPGRGATRSSQTIISKLSCFNSRTLGGVRQSTSPLMEQATRFNSRTLGGVRQESGRLDT